MNLHKTRHINWFYNNSESHHTPGSWPGRNWSVWQTIIRNCLRAKFSARFCGTIGHSLTELYFEILLERKSSKKRHQGGKVVFVGPKETGLSSAMEIFLHSSKGINLIPIGIENMIKRSLCSFFLLDVCAEEAWLIYANMPAWLSLVWRLPWLTTSISLGGSWLLC